MPLACTSTSHAVQAGIAQGTVISQTVLNLFVSNYPHNIQLRITYADDVQAAQSSTNPQEDADVLTVGEETVREWADKRGLQMTTRKLQVTPFTFDTPNHNYII